MSTTVDEEPIIVRKNATRIINENWGQLTWFANEERGNSADMTVGRCILKPGKSNPRHRHPNCSEVLVVMRGEIEHTGPGGKMVRMSEGDVITIPEGFIHQARNVGNRNAVLMLSYDTSNRQTIGE